VQLPLSDIPGLISPEIAFYGKKPGIACLGRCVFSVCFVCFATAQTSSTPSIHGWPAHMASLPSFLDPLPERSSNGPYMNAVFNHPYPLGPAHCLWWPPLKPGMRIETIVLFIPGRSTSFLCRHRLTHSQETPAYLTFTLLF